MLTIIVSVYDKLGGGWKSEDIKTKKRRFSVCRLFDADSLCRRR